MQKWEYLEVIKNGEEVLINGEIVAQATGGILGMGKKKPNIVSILNDLGEQGWELVTATGIQIFLFKRPKK